MKYTLGLDLGQSSIGWAVLKNNEDQQPVSLENWGVRIFPDGRDAKSHEPLAVNRRMKRSERRRRDRFLARKKELMRVLVAHKLMPESQSEQKKLESFNPFALRAKAAEEKVSLHELGRCLLHIAQHRGFKSNRKADNVTDEKEASAMKDGISELKKTLGNKTLGQLLYERQQKGQWVRFRPTDQKGQKNQWDLGYPDRSMYEREVKTIWSVQKEHHDELTGELYKKLHKIILQQRPLRKPEVGRCIFEHQSRGEEGERAPLALPIVQRFRIWQEVNNLEIEYFDTNSERLSPENRQEIASQLLYTQDGKNHVSKKGELTFTNIRKKVLKSDKDYKFNLESIRKSLNADIVTGQLSSKDCFGSQWFDFTDEKQTKIVRRIIDEEEENELIEWLIQQATLSEDNAANAARIDIPEGYGKVSLKAIKKILPHLEKGKKYHEACLAAGYQHTQQDTEQLRQYLPYYGEIMPDTVIGENKEKGDPKKSPEVFYGKITNPTVHIGLNQLRKLINAIIETYGNPDRIVIELARELKMSQEQKRNYEKRISDNTDKNAQIDDILKEQNVERNRLNRQKFKLWEELADAPNERCCPFTGHIISLESLLSEKVEIEHLLPFSRTYDDSPANKVVCLRNANRYKGNHTPYEAFGSSPDGYDWEAILARSTNMPKNKSWRFKPDAMEKYLKDGDGIARLLNDTKYLSRIAHRYLKCICKDVYPVTGQMTAMLRHAWGINHLLGEVEKNRGDHRHHALDAFVIGCTSRRTMQLISASSAKAENQGSFKEIFRNWPPPWNDFSPQQFEKPLSRVVVSHKLDHGNAEQSAKENKTIGQLHQDTNYGLIKENGSNSITLTARVPLIGKASSNDSGIARKPKNINEIATDWIRNDLLKLAETSTDKKWKEDVAKYGKKHGIRHVRIHIRKDPNTVRKIEHKDKDENLFYRYVATGSNYCAEIYEPTFDSKGNWLPKEKRRWQAEIISMYDVHNKRFTPTWKKNNPTARKVMRLHINDMMALDTERQAKFYRVKKLRQDGRIYVREHTIAKEKNDELSLGLSASSLRKKCAIKVSVDVMGRVKMPK